MATTVNYVECPRCKKKIPEDKSVQACRYCGAPAPWAKAPMPKVRPIKTQASSAPSTAPSIDWGFWGVAAFSFFIPPIGYFLYRSYAESGDEKAMAAGMGALIGLLAHIGRIAWKFAY